MDQVWTRKPKLEGETYEKQRIYRKRWLDKRRSAGLPHYRSPTDVRRMEEARVRIEARNAALTERKERREAEKAERKERLTLERKSKLVAVVAKNAESRKPKAIKTTPAPQRTQTVEEFIASGGKVERLPRGATSGKLAA